MRELIVAQQLIDLTNSNADLACILLSNMAKSDSILKVFDVQVSLKTDKQKEVFKSSKAINCLMDLFVKGGDRKLNSYANYDYLAYFFADISRFKKGRQYFITEQKYDGVVPLMKLLVFTEKYDCKARRQGVSSIIKNSLFDTDQQMRLLENRDINLLPYLLSPIALADNKGLSEEEVMELPEELQLLGSDKKTEPLKEISTVYLEAILLLCVTRKGREYLRENGVYPIVREFDRATKDDQITDLCYRIVDMLMRDEKSQDLYDPEQEIAEIRQYLSSQEATNGIDDDANDTDDTDDTDDVDGMIVEVA
ncbi:hypothetical protein FOA43_002540 [Brettanomyces nanus]|uniref:Protein HGH1 homolog n=1 Tax=Eeniella nana TaxID=13502 RepID=A0A875RPK9_EENNA|nr:uncharacterized protein FOA43_002540 [Brettanomyces nanus]QPG75190.1 hypothetical protein FOA43_002540 [Brettanomyces nanus]